MREIHTKAGPLLDYFWYFLLVFVLYFLTNTYTSWSFVASGSSTETLLGWGYRIVISPLILAGLFGGMRARQQTHETSFARGFFASLKKDYWRLLAANFLALVFYFIVAIVVTIAGYKAPASGAYTPLIACISGTISALTMFWYVAIVVEHNLFGGLWRGVKTLLLNPYALTLGIVWGTLSSADTFFFANPVNPGSLALSGLRAGVLAALRIITIAYALAIYEQTRTSEAPAEIPQETALLETPSRSSGDGWITASIAFTFLAFIPLLHLLALAFGLIALRCKKRFVFRAAIACGVGGFFTIYYLMLIAGLIVSNNSPAKAPGYTFLAQANPSVAQQVALLEHGTTQQIRSLELDPADVSAQDWTADCISALARARDDDRSGALADFQSAAVKNPGPGEFYYYYGVALLDNKQPEPAAAQFQAALQREPKLVAAQEYLDLINATYKPSPLISGILSMIILLVLFALHEFGHAYAAWKLGDDTAKNLGRLTLNPLRHLDPLGSIILPGILLIQNAGLVFGWAKPVPVNPANFKDPKKDHMRVSFTGPAVNLIVSMGCFIALGFLFLGMRLVWPQTLGLGLSTPYSSVSLVGPPFAGGLVVIIVIIKQMLYTSLVLGCLNLIPVPPLDGSWILAGVLPEKLAILFEKTRRFGFLIFLLLVVTPVFDWLLSVPLGVVWAGLEILTSVLKLG